MTPSCGELHLPRQYPLSRSTNIDAEVSNRIVKASSAFRRLKMSVWEQREISQCTKIKVYTAVVLTTLLYGCETWTIYRRHEALLQQFHLSCLSNIFCYKTRSRTPRFWRERTSPASLPSCAKLRHDGQDTLVVCQTPGYPSSCSTVYAVVVAGK